MMQYGNEAEDKWFHWKGARPPERTPHGIKEDEIEDMLANNLKGHTCSFYQNGADITCDQGDFVHGRRIGANQRLLDSTGKLGLIGPVLRDA